MISTAAERFYHDILGLEIVSRMDDRGLAFRCGATVLLVFDPRGLAFPTRACRRMAQRAKGISPLPSTIPNSLLGAIA